MLCFAQVYYLHKMYIISQVDWLPEKHTNMVEKPCIPMPSLIAYIREKANHRKDYRFRVVQIQAGQVLKQIVRTILEVRRLPMVIYT